MKTDVVTKDCWIMGQLAGIHMLEQELKEALKVPGARTSADLHRRVEQLNSWVKLVDDALTVQARSRRTPARMSSQVAAPRPMHQSSHRVPAA